ncbi:uncharacterized protein [Dysidea avara]|uniref:uncharacterized protein n=1 Tax=Dysidea avara TaxID=196820 RepID=UPI0033280EBD
MPTTTAVPDKSTTTAISTSSKKQLESILKGQPCHVVKARIGRFTIHHGSFHTLKPGTYINDEIVNGYLRLIANIHGNCYIIGTFSLTAIINRAAVNISSHLLSKEILTTKKMLAGNRSGSKNLLPSEPIWIKPFCSWDFWKYFKT